MSAYMYPTHPCGNWVEKIRDEWKKSCKPYFSLWYLLVTPKQLISGQCNGLPFWLYMYYSKTAIKKECPEDLPQAMQVKYRIRVIEYKTHEPYTDSNVHAVVPPGSPTIWFKCDRFEEIRKINRTEQCEEGQNILTFHDFKHAGNAALGPALLKTIPPVQCIVPIVVVQTNWYETETQG